MAVLVGKKQLTKSIGAAATPVPVNTPSLRSEIKSKEPWGGAGSSTTTSSSISGRTHELAPALGGAKPASWAANKDDNASSNLNNNTSGATNSNNGSSGNAPTGHNWALRDDSDDDADDPVRQRPTTASASNINTTSRERDWGRENYRDHDEDDHYNSYNNNGYGQRSRGNSDLHRYQPRFNKVSNSVWVFFFFFNIPIRFLLFLFFPYNLFLSKLVTQELFLFC